MRQIGIRRDEGLAYRAGDSLGIWPVNDPRVVEEVARLTGKPPEDLADLDVTRPSAALLDFVGRHSRETGLTADWCWGRQTADVLRAFPVRAEPVRVAQPPPAPAAAGQYSISSAPEAHPTRCS